MLLSLIALIVFAHLGERDFGPHSVKKKTAFGPWGVAFLSLLIITVIAYSSLSQPDFPLSHSNEWSATCVHISYIAVLGGLGFPC